MTPQRTLFIIEHPRAELAQQQVSGIAALVGGSDVLVARCAGRSPLPCETVFFDDIADEAALDVLPETASELDVALFGFAPEESLPLGWVRHLAAFRVAAVRRVGVAPGTAAQLELVAHRPRSRRQARVLSVFPGPIVPTAMGAHQRAFGVLEALVRDGIQCDVLITCRHAHEEALARPILEQLCARVHVNGRSRQRLPPRLLARRAAETAIRRARGLTHPAPRLFEERWHTAPGLVGRVRLRRLLSTRQYDPVIVNFAWMEPIRSLVPPRLARAHRWICDTHDVQFLRTATHNRGEIRFGVSIEREKRVELGALDRFDHIIGISAGDSEVLCRAVREPSRVLEVPTGFDYAVQPPRAPDPEAPVFAFIGGGMDANVKAVQYLIAEWWPAIRARWPNATLRMAGRVSDAERVRRTASEAPGVELVGYVTSLRRFYADVDCLLSPVVVRGGLNFKAVECVMVGRLLVTTPLGVQCLGENGLGQVAVTGDEVARLVDKELGSAPAAWERRRRRTQRLAGERYGDDAAYQGLRELLRSPAITEAATRSSGPRRVLIQVGDHFENWTRTVAMAEQIRERGHHPIALVYKEEGYNYFLAHGVDVVALHHFDEPPWVSRARRLVLRSRPSLVPRFYRLYDRDDLSAAASQGPVHTCARPAGSA